MSDPLCCVCERPVTGYTPAFNDLSPGVGNPCCSIKCAKAFNKMCQIPDWRGLNALGPDSQTS